MANDHIYAFVDGGHLRHTAKEKHGIEFPHPVEFAKKVVSDRIGSAIPLRRVYYYDAEPEEGPKDPNLDAYWNVVQTCLDTELRFGFLRGKSQRKPRKQKGVDVLLAVDLVVGAFTGIFDTGVVITGDADFIPAIQEAKRRGVRVVIGTFPGGLSDALAREADRSMEFLDQGCRTNPSYSLATLVIEEAQRMRRFGN